MRRGARRGAGCGFDAATLGFRGSAIDEGPPGGHDDPQHFDLRAWGDALCTHLAALGAGCTG